MAVFVDTSGFYALLDARERRLILTDCVSIEVMRQRSVQRFIGNDDHFAREGFRLA